jgi:hypothetical protein
LEKPGLDPKDTVRGLGHGVIQGAIESDADLEEAISTAFETVDELTSQTGIECSEVVSHLADGMLQASKAHGFDTQAQVERLVGRYWHEIQKPGGSNTV